MKTIKIYTREILVRTGFRKYPFKKKKEYTVIYNGRELANHYENIDNPRLRVKFNEVLKTRSLSALREFQKKLRKTNDDQHLLAAIETIING